MRKILAVLAVAAAFLACPAVVLTHPMGNFSVSHYAKLQPGAASVDLRYVLDLAEIPTLELLQSWSLERTASPGELNAHAFKQAKKWIAHVRVTVDGRTAAVQLDSVKATIADGAGNLPILRVEMGSHVPVGAAQSIHRTLTYEDGNYPERAGWKEIVIASGSAISLNKVSQADRELSAALTNYPADPTVAPPQDLRAELEWTSVTPLASARATKPAASSPLPPSRQSPVITNIPQPHVAPAAVAPSTLTAQGAPAGAVIRGDFLSRLMHQKDLTFSFILAALAAAFGLGALHALTPGHGKAIVAAYLVGSRGTLKHAAFLGAMVTFTHTISVFALGLATLFLFRFIVPEKITAILAAISGLSIVAIGAVMLYRRIHNLGHTHSHGHEHLHSPMDGHTIEHTHAHDHAHSHAAVPVPSNESVSHAHAHTHTHDGHTHTHDGRIHPDVHPHSHALTSDHSHPHGTAVLTHSHGPGGHSHSHVPEELSWGGLVALGASGGLVPCESALVLLLGAIALNRVALGLLLLASFSLGLALVLMAIGVLVLYAKNLLPESTRSGGHPFLRWVSLASPAIVIVVGLLMTAASFGWIQSKWMIG